MLAIEDLLQADAAVPVLVDRLQVDVADRDGETVFHALLHALAIELREPVDGPRASEQQVVVGALPRRVRARCRTDLG